MCDMKAFRPVFKLLYGELAFIRLRLESPEKLKPNQPEKLKPKLT